MLSDQDIQKLSKTLASKKDLEQLVSRREFSELKNDFGDFRTEFGGFKDKIFTVLDGIAKSIEDLKMEYVAIKTQLDRHERWIKELAEKTGCPLPENGS